MNLAFFTQEPAPPGDPGGGVGHAIMGTLMMIGIASCIGLPLGLLGGIYLAEFGNNRFGFLVRFAADVLNGVPSIVVGIFVYAVAILPLPENGRHFSAWAGGLALGLMMIPTVMRTTEEMVRLVPMSLREAALALGATRWRTVFKIVLGSAKGGVITGILLAIARVAGETAPLLFTALGNNFFSKNPNGPTASLPVTIYNFASSPDERWNSLAWGGALVLVAMVCILSIAARYATRKRA
jgi:phosphate transport system permease protein